MTSLLVLLCPPRQAAAAVGVGACWPWETAATLPSARRRKALRRPRGEERGGAYRGGRPPTACLICNLFQMPLETRNEKQVR